MPEEISNLTDVELFWLAKVFPDPVAIIDFSPPPLKELCQNALFVFDTNTLLAPFDLSSNSVSDIERIYTRLHEESRLSVPAHAVREFGKNRGKKIANIFQEIGNRLSTNLPSIQPLTCPILEGHPEYNKVNELVAELSNYKKQYKATLQQLGEIIKTWNWEDRVSKLYRAIFTSETIVDHSLDEKALREHHKERYSRKQPPGYKDAGKTDGGIGDLIIWFTLLELGEKRNTDIVFVCNEEKHDWFYRMHEEPVIPRLELLQEYHTRTKRHFSIRGPIKMGHWRSVIAITISGYGDYGYLSAFLRSF